MNSAASSETPLGRDGTAPAAGAAAQDGADSRREALSAWLDGEVEPGAARSIVADLLEPGPARRLYEEWGLVGDAIRSQEVAAGHSPRLCARICEALQDEPALLAPRALPAAARRTASTTRHVASGFAIAAAAAVVVFFAVPQLRGGLDGGAAQTAMQAAQQPGAGATGSAELASIPRGGAARPDAGKRDPRLDPYLRAHRDFSGAGVMPQEAAYLRFGNEGDR